MIVPFDGEDVVAERLPRRRSDDPWALAVGIGSRDEDVSDISRIGEEQRRASDVEAGSVTEYPVAGGEKSRLVESEPGRVTDERQAKQSGSERERKRAFTHPSGRLLAGTVAGPIHENARSSFTPPPVPT
jgi:hypothetical protein